MGGHAFPNIQQIHYKELNDLLEKVGDLLHISRDTLYMRLLGTAQNMYLLNRIGRAPFFYIDDTEKYIYINDVDIAMPKKTNKKKLLQQLTDKLGDKNVKMFGDTISLSIGFKSKNVQIDLMIGDINWMHKFYYSCLFSKFKGVHRNLLLKAVTQALRVTKPSRDGGPPLEEIGWVLSNKVGFIERKRTRVVENGKLLKKIVEVDLSKPTKSLIKIADHLFGIKKTEILDKTESLYKVICDTYPFYIRTKIFKNFVAMMSEEHKDNKYPWNLLPEIERELSNELGLQTFK